MVFLSVFEMQGELVLAPADLKPIWCWKFSGLAGPVAVFGKAGTAGSQLWLVFCTLTVLWEILHSLETDLHGCPPSLYGGDG